jgi:ABC-type transport system substrate-binding protein
MKKALLFSIAMLAILAITIVPNVGAWCIPGPTPGEDYKYEVYGPHFKGILIPIYTSEEAEWTAMDNNQLDLEDWPLTSAWLAHWTGDARFTIQNYGGEAGFFILDINNNETLPDGSPNPCTVVSFRRALAYIVNRTHIVNDICGGLGLAMWTPVPRYMSGYVNHYIEPGAELANLTYGGMTGDLSAAAALLDADHFPIGTDGWRYWDRNTNGVEDAGEHVKLIFYSRSDSGQRLAFADDYVLKLRAQPICIDVDYRPRPRATCSADVMGAKNFHLYTGGWISIGPDPDFLYDLFYSEMYWHPGKPPNYNNVHDPLLDFWLEKIKFANTAAEGLDATLTAQEIFATYAFKVPLWCASGYKAYRNNPVEEPSAQLTHVVNQMGFGVNSWWTTLNAMETTNDYPPIYLRYGFMSDCDKLNPVYSEWYWEWEVLGRIYDGGAGRDPMTLATWIPQLYKAWTVGLWKDPKTGEDKSKVRITLRDDCYWQDGTPVTMADVYYTLIEVVDDMLAKGLPPPWWYPTVQYFRSVYVIDPYNIEILLDVKSVWAVGWVIGTIVLPKHIWKPIVDRTTTANMDLDDNLHTALPDPNLIGSGPYRFAEWTKGVHIVLDANTPGSVEHSITSPGYWQYSPIKISYDIRDPPELAYRHKLPFEPANMTWSGTVTNLFADRNVNGYEEIKMNTTSLANETYTLAPQETVCTENLDGMFNLIFGISFYHCSAADDLIPYPHIDYEKWILVHSKGVWITYNDIYIAYIPYCEYFWLVSKVQFTIPNPPGIPVSTTWGWDLEWYQHTIKEDIVGSTWYNDVYTQLHKLPPELAVRLPPEMDDILAAYPYKSELPTCDFKVDIKDVAAASKAFGTYPGHKFWNPIADINGDYKVDIKDVAAISKKFGWHA